MYDAGQLAIPGDRVDKEQLLAPSHWDIGFIRRFMFLFGPISSLFDFATFALMLFVFDAVPGEFRAGWFIESIVTQTLIIFVIRTRRVPFFRSRPSLGLVGASAGVVALGIYLPLSPLAGVLGFDPLPVPFFLALLGMAGMYLVLVEIAKLWFYSRAAQQPVLPKPAGCPGPFPPHRATGRTVQHFECRTPAPSPGSQQRPPENEARKVRHELNTRPGLMELIADEPAFLIDEGGVRPSGWKR